MLNINKNIGSITPLFTPSYYRQAYNSYKIGIVGNLVAMFEQCELDTHISGCLLGRNAGYKREWKIDPAGDKKAELAIADWLEEYFDNFNMRDMFEDIMDAKYKKFAVIQYDDWTVAENKQVPAGFTQLHQKYFRIDTKDNDKIKIDKSNVLLEIKEDEALVVTYRKAPVLMPVLRDYILKEFGVESWAAFMETFGEPFIIGKYPPGADPDFKDQLKEAVNNIASSSRGTAPMGSEFEIKETQRTTGDHEKFVDRCDRGISISLLGHENAVAQGSKMQVGENLEAYKVKRDVMIEDVYFIQDALDKLIRMLVKRNFPAVTRFPKFVIDKKEQLNVKDHLAILDQAYEQGMAIDPWEYGQYGVKIFDNQKPLEKKDLLD